MGRKSARRSGLLTGMRFGHRASGAAGPFAALVLVLSSTSVWAELSTKQRLDLLERRVDRITDLTLQLDQVQAENRDLRGQIEQLGYEIEQLKRMQRDIYQDVDQRLGALQPGGASQSPAAAGEGGDGDPATPPLPTGQAPTGAAGGDPAKIQAEYQAAYDLLNPKQKRYAEAAKAFSAFVRKYPNHALAPNAQYWLGEAYYVTQKNADARKAFDVVVERYPGSTKMPDALYKLGRLHEAAGRRDAARRSYERVVTEYANSSAAGLAGQRLAKLR